MNQIKVFWYQSVHKSFGSFGSRTEIEYTSSKKGYEEITELELTEQYGGTEKNPLSDQFSIYFAIQSPTERRLKCQMYRSVSASFFRLTTTTTNVSTISGPFYSSKMIFYPYLESVTVLTDDPFS